MKKSSLLIGLLIFGFVAQAQVYQIDSLEKLIPQAKNTSNKIHILNQLTYWLSVYDIEKANRYSKQALSLAQKDNYPQGIAASKNAMGRVYYIQGDYRKALELHFEALRGYESIKDSLGMAETLNKIATVYTREVDAENTMKYALQAKEIAKGIGNKKALAESFFNVARSYFVKNDYNNSIAYYQQALIIGLKISDLEGITYAYNNMGVTYARMGDYEKASEFYQKSLEMNEKYIKDYTMLAATFDNIGDIKRLTSQYDSARYYTEKGLAFGQKVNARNRVMESYESLMQLYKLLKDDAKTLEYYEKFINLKDSLFSEQKSQSLKTLESDYEAEKAQIKTNLLNKERQFQKFIFYVLIGSLLFVLLITFLLWRNNLRKHRDNMLLEQKQEEIEEKNEALFESNKQIKASIQAAQLIQNAILPSPQKLQQLFPDHFLIYKPKDMVSGDFYWASEVEGKILLAVADCTGHSVAGALMSMVSATLLDRLMRLRVSLSPAMVLENLDLEIRNLLKQNEGSNNESGLDIAFINIEKQSNGIFRITFAGARRPLFYFKKSENEMHILKGARKTIGGKLSEKKSFEEQQFILQKGDILFLSTDGYTDQNNELAEKIGTQNFLKFMESHIDKPMTAQKIALENFLTIYQANTQQRDDILVMGIRLS
jgi:serine phosphatase RsbU (regulator of sigma subunit)